MKVRFFKQIHSCFASWSSDDVSVYHDVDIPIAPQIGMTVMDHDWEDIVKSICFNAASGLITVTTYSDDTLHLSPYKKDKENLPPIGDIVDDYINEGWLRKPEDMGLT